MKQDALNRAIMRRADADGGVDSISVNGGTPITGPVDIESDMASFVAPNIIRIDNANTKIGLVTNTVTQADLDTELNNAFFIDWEPGAVMFPPPKVPTAVGFSLGRKITYTFVYEGVGGADSITFDNSADGYQFSQPAVAGAVGPFLTDVNALIAGIVADPGHRSLAFKIGFEYVGGAFKAFTSNWVCVALAGPFF